jgi:cell division protein FtsW (lipid II flippase)
MSARSMVSSARRPGVGAFLVMGATVGLAVTVAYFAVLLVKYRGYDTFPAADLLPLGLYLAGSVAVTLSFLVARSGADPAMAAAALFLAGIGVVTRYRLNEEPMTLALAPADWALPGGLVLLAVTALVLRGGRHRFLSRAAIPCWIVALGVLVVMAVFGQRFRGAIFLAGGLNPSELVKPLAAVYLAAFLAGRGRDFARQPLGVPLPTGPAAVWLWVSWAALVLPLVYLRDLGMLVLLNVALLAVLFVAVRRRRVLVLGVVLTAVLVAAVFHFSDHGRQRFLVWLDPYRDPTGASWQTLQAQSALFAGGLWGAGLGRGSPGVIPIASSDFVYAVVGEELGYVGCGIALLAFLVLFHRGHRLAREAADEFTRLLAAGLTTMLAVQTFLNVGGVAKFVPLTGIPLPFVSQGGSSLVVSFLCVGLLLALSDGGTGGAAASGTSGEPTRRRRRKRA